MDPDTKSILMAASLAGIQACLFIWLLARTVCKTKNKDNPQ